MRKETLHTPLSTHLELVQLGSLLDLEEHLGAIGGTDLDVEGVVCKRRVSGRKPNKETG
jgi:hypothetical protein